MFESIKNFLRRRKVRKLSRAIPTGMLPLSEISTVNVVIEVEEAGYDILKEEILAWGRANGLKVNIYFFDFRKIAKDELLLTSIQTTIVKKELNWFGMPAYEKVVGLLEEKSDLLISLIDDGDFPIDFIMKCSCARFKIGRRAYPGHVYDIVISDRPAEGLRSGGSQVFAAIIEFLGKISL